MAHPLQQASVRRKIWYFAALVALFTLSLFWRGKLNVPLAEAGREPDNAPTAANRVADRVARLSIADQAKPSRLDLRELDQGDAEVGAAAVRLLLTGSRGVAVSLLWQGAIAKQKRNEFHEFEMLARAVTRLQPNFVLPWLYQGWNIAYNVSVETDKLGDMYFYIARGIELLTEGDRLNTKTVTVPGDKWTVGSPDLRKEIGFFYMNKFGVSDKVATLRCLMNLSCLPPGQRDARSLRPVGSDAGVEPEAFKKFCKANPQLVRRLRASLKLERPEEIVGFLEDNQKIPTRFKPTGEKAEVKDQYPAFPPAFPEGADEFHPESGTDDTFDAYLAARSWLNYGVSTIPPPKTDAGGRAIPWDRPKPGEYNEYRYRMPRSPAYILYRQQPCLAQTKLAERLAKEGWFDSESAWDPDDRAGPSALWFRKSEADPGDALRTPDSSRAQWDKTYAIWLKYAAENAMQLDNATLLNFREMADKVPGDVGGFGEADYTPERLRSLRITQADVDAKKALRFYEQNRSMSNFPYFLGTSEAERDPRTVKARKLLLGAEQARLAAENTAAARDYVDGLALLREVFGDFPRFHRPERSDQTEENFYETELALIGLLKEDGGVRAKAAAAAKASGALFPALAEQTADAWLQAVAEDEAGARVAAGDRRVRDRARQRARDRQERAAREAGPRAEALAPAAHHVAIALAGFGAQAPGHGGDALKTAIQQAIAADSGDVSPADLRAVVDGEFSWLKDYMSDAKTDPWVRPHVRDMVRNRLGLSRTQTPVPEKEGG